MRVKGDKSLLYKFHLDDRIETTEFEINIDAEEMVLLLGDELEISNDDGSYKVECPNISYVIYKLVK